MPQEDGGLKPHRWEVVGDDILYTAAKLYRCPGCLCHVWYDWYEETMRDAMRKAGIPEDCGEALVGSVLGS